MKRFCKTCGGELENGTNVCSICGSVYTDNEANGTTVLNQGGPYASNPVNGAQQGFNGHGLRGQSAAGNVHMQNPYLKNQNAQRPGNAQGGMGFANPNTPYGNMHSGNAPAGSKAPNKAPMRMQNGAKAAYAAAGNAAVKTKTNLPIPVWAIVLIAVAAAAIIAVAIALIVNFTAANPMREALQANDGDLVNMVYYEAYGSESKIKKYDELIGDKLDEISNSLESYSFDEEAKTAGDMAVDDFLQYEFGTLIINPNGESIENVISSENWEAWQELNTALVSKSYYCSGIYEYYTENDYDSAIADFSTVSADDSCYENAVAMLGECVGEYIKSTLAAVDESVAAGDINGGISLLNSAKEYLISYNLDSNEIQQKLDETLVTYADSYAQKAEAAFKEHDVNAAIGNIKVAIELQPDNEDYKTKQDTYQQYLPFYLYLEENVLYEEEDSSSWSGSINFDDTRTTNTNKEMNNCIIWNTGSSDANSHFTEYYNLEGRYDTVTGTVFLSDSHKDEKDECYFEAYGDGKLLYTSPKISAGFLPQDISFSVSGVQELKIVFKGHGYGYVSNLTAQKDFPE